MRLGRTVLSFIAIVIAFTIYGTYREHGDTNAGGMYGLIAIVPGAVVSLMSYLLYYVVQLNTHYKTATLKIYVHLILGTVLIWLDPKGAMFMILVLGLVIILVINSVADLVKPFST